MQSFYTVLFWVVLVAASPANIEFTLEQSALEFAGMEISTRILPALGTIVIPEQPKQDFHCGGKCAVQLRGGKLWGMSCPPPKFQITAPAQITALVSNCQVDTDIAWWIHRSTFPSASCSGTVDGAISGLSVDATIVLERASSGALAFSVQNAGVHLSSINLHFHGDCKLLINPARHLIDDIIKKVVNGELNKRLPQLLNKELQRFTPPLSFPVPELPGIDVNLALSRAPAAVSNNAGINFAVSGLFGYRGAAGDPACTVDSPAPVPPTGSQYDLYLAVSECSLSSLTASMFNAGLLQFATNYTFLGMNFNVLAGVSQPPVVSFSSSAATLNVSSSVNLTETSSGTGFGLEVGLSLPFSLKFNNQNLTGNITDILIDSLAFTYNTQNITMPVVKAFLNEALEKVVVPEVNKLLAVGITLPVVDGVEFIDDQVFTVAGWSYMATKFKQTFV